MTERDIKRALGKRVRRGEKGFYYQAELTDIRCGQSLIYAPLVNVERSETI